MSDLKFEPLSLGMVMIAALMAFAGLWVWVLWWAAGALIDIATDGLE